MLEIAQPLLKDAMLYLPHALLPNKPRSSMRLDPGNMCRKIIVMLPKRAFLQKPGDSVGDSFSEF